MEPNETFVESNGAEADQLPEGLIAETGDETEEVDLSDVVDTSEGTETAEDQSGEAEPNVPPAKEPGYVKQRIDKAVARATAETEARMMAEFNQRMAPIMERLLVEDAKELVREGKIKDLDTAKEYLRMKQGMPVPADTSEEQPRNANGQFAPKQNAADAATQARIDMLTHQANAIKNRSGVDVIKVFNENPDIKQRVIAGEIDFYDVAEEIGQPKKSRPPAPMRSPNGAANDQQLNALMTMSSAEFRKLEKRIQSGGLRIRQK